MKKTTQIISYVLIAIILAIMGALLGWYLYIHSKQSSIQTVDTARGLTTPADTGGGFGDGSSATPAGTPDAIGQNPLASSASTGTAISSALWMIDRNPVAGFGFLASSTTASLEYISRSSGYLTQALPLSRTTTRITSNLMPKIYEASVAGDGSVVLRSIDSSGSITTFLGVPKSATTSDSITQQTSLTGWYITPNIRHLILDSRTKSLTYSLDSSQGESVVNADWTSTKPKTLFTSVIENWMISAPGDGRTFVTEAPSDGITGYAYEIKSGTPVFLKSGPGLMILPQPSGKGLLWSTSSGGSTTLYAQSSSATSSITLSVRTVASKCVWYPSTAPVVYCAVPQNGSSEGFVLDDWFAGLAHTSDAWWEIDLSTGTAQKIFTPSGTISAIDVTNPQIDPSGNFIAFINGTDGSLWSLKITQ